MIKPILLYYMRLREQHCAWERQLLTRCMMKLSRVFYVPSHTDDEIMVQNKCVHTSHRTYQYEEHIYLSKTFVLLDLAETGNPVSC